MTVTKSIAVLPTDTEVGRHLGVKLGLVGGPFVKFAFEGQVMTGVEVVPQKYFIPGAILAVIARAVPEVVDVDRKVANPELAASEGSACASPPCRRS